MNIVLIALDTQRADHLGCYGYPKATSPFLDSIAAQGVVFERCYAPNIPTHPSFTTMLTGKEAITHNIVNIGGGVPIKAGNEVIGGVGVSGAPGGEKDEACANAGLAKVADALK